MPLKVSEFPRLLPEAPHREVSRPSTMRCCCGALNILTQKRCWQCHRSMVSTQCKEFANWKTGASGKCKRFMRCSSAGKEECVATG